jgi:hypothetical protein
MALSVTQKEDIEKLLSRKIENKLSRYDRETTSMPFLARLIQDSEKIAAYSFIHSLSTTLGMSIYEDVSCIIARESAEECSRNYGVGGSLSAAQRKVIGSIVNGLREGTRTPNIYEETAEVLAASNTGANFQQSGNIADYFFEIKTVKPNIDVFEKSKTKLLEWVARRRQKVKVFLAFPYNPYHPQVYSRFTTVNLMDSGNDFLVGNEYWDMLGGENTFTQLLEVFDITGRKYKKQLENKFKEIAQKKIDSY